MSSLQDIRSRVKSSLNITLDNAERETELDTTIKSALNTFWDSHSWSFKQREVTLQLFPDVTHSMTGLTLSTEDASRKVFLSGALEHLLPHNYEGEVIAIKGVEYTISKVIDQSAVLLTTPFRGDTESGITDWVLRKNYLYLPDDCARIDAVHFAGRTGAPITLSLTPVTKSEATLRGLFSTLTSSLPTCYVEMEPLRIKAGEKLKVGTIDTSVLSDLEENYYYEFAWSFYVAGKAGPISEPLTVQVVSPAANQPGHIALELMSANGKPVVSEAYDTLYDRLRMNKYEGLRKVLWVNTNYDHAAGIRLGLPCWTQVTRYTDKQEENTLPLVLEDTEYQVQINFVDQLHPDNARYCHKAGVKDRISTLPRWSSYTQEHGEAKILAPLELPPRYVQLAASFFAPINITYMATCPDFSKQTDNLDIHPDCEEAIVFLAASRYAMKTGNMNLMSVFRAEYERETAKLLGTYTAQPQGVFVKRPLFNRPGSY